MKFKVTVKVEYYEKFTYFPVNMYICLLVWEMYIQKTFTISKKGNVH